MNSLRTRTKVICTIGPSVASPEKILELIDAGMNVARINFSHGNYDDHKKVIDMLKKAREKRGVPLAIMLDTKGPEIRIGEISGGEIAVVTGDKLVLVEIPTTAKDEIQIVPEGILKDIDEDVSVLFDDGYITSKVIAKEKGRITVKILNSGKIKSRKGVNIPGAQIDLPALTPKDIEDIIFGCKEDVDIVAASFIRSADHIQEIKKLLIQHGKADVLVLAKIENSIGVKNFDSIVQASDGIMIARGDLGVELPLKQVPMLQKMMIRNCYKVAKPVVTATQMLESMIQCPRPTRAEVSDVANAIYDSSSAVMLSGETAMGQYPIATVKMMKEIIEESEKQFDYSEFFYRDSKSSFNDISQSIALATVKTAYNSNAKAIFTYTNSGQIVRMLSRFRPKMPIIALTSNPKVYHQMALFWGANPVKPCPCSNNEEAFKIMTEYALKQKLCKYGDIVVIASGNPFGIKGTTNMMIVESIGDVLVRGYSSEGPVVHGKIAIIHTPEKKKESDVKERIVVISRFDKSYIPLLKYALGIVMHNTPDDKQSEKEAQEFARSLNLPLLIRADGALDFLKEDRSVTLDPQQGLVYKSRVGKGPEDL